MRVKAPLLPPVTVTSVASKLLPTSLLKLKVSVTSPLAVLPAALLVTVATGGKVSKAWLFAAPWPRLPTVSS